MMLRAMFCAATVIGLGALADGAAAPVSHWFDLANGFYKQERFDSAEVYYRRIAEAGVSNAALYYNLGNACFRQNKLGLSILFYERARRLSAGDADIEHNLRFARAAIVDRVPEPERTFLESALAGFHSLLSLQTQLWVLTGLLLAMSVLIAMAFFVSHNTRLWLLYSVVLILVAFGALGVSAGVKIYQCEYVHEAVVLAPSIEALNAPDGDKVLFKAHEGTLFVIRQEVDEWCLVSLPNGKSGWVRASSLGRI